jgi:hypothetical protein
VIPKPPPSALPPAIAEYVSAMHAGPGKPPKLHHWKMFRSSKGDTHLDFGKTALITKPRQQQAILLDHVKKEARKIPLPHGLPHFPHVHPPVARVPALKPAPPQPATLLHVKDLGKQIVAGHDAEGKLYTFAPPKLPKAPALNLPHAPALPKGAQPKAPQAPKAPSPAPQTHTMEVWTHAKLKVPVLTKFNGSPGLQSSVCKEAKAAEPPASRFEIPPGYKVIEPKMAKAPGFKR